MRQQFCEQTTMSEHGFNSGPGHIALDCLQQFRPQTKISVRFGVWGIGRPSIKVIVHPIASIFINRDGYRIEDLINC